MKHHNRVYINVTTGDVEAVTTALQSLRSLKESISQMPKDTWRDALLDLIAGAEKHGSSAIKGGGGKVVKDRSNKARKKAAPYTSKQSVAAPFTPEQSVDLGEWFRANGMNALSPLIYEKSKRPLHTVPVWDLNCLLQTHIEEHRGKRPCNRFGGYNLRLIGSAEKAFAALKKLISLFPDRDLKFITDRLEYTEEQWCNCYDVEKS